MPCIGIERTPIAIFFFASSSLDVGILANESDVECLDAPVRVALSIILLLTNIPIGLQPGVLASPLVPLTPQDPASLRLVTPIIDVKRPDPLARRIFELVRTEENYLKSLKQLRDDFWQPLVVRCG